MPDLTTNVEFIAADHPRYADEKPYWAFLREGQSFGPSVPTNNMEFESHDVVIQNMRGRENEFKLDHCGFEVVYHEPSTLHLEDVESCEAYQRETKVFLRNYFEAEGVACYGLRRRHAIKKSGSIILDTHSILVEEGAARGAHNDVTFESGPTIIERHLSQELKKRYLKPGYRFRIINTWRPLLPIIEHKPLALCDYRTLNPVDMIGVDRILPDRTGEIYFVRYKETQKWCWLEKQTPNELFVFIMYDTHPSPGQARMCPHAAFDNPRAPADAPPRRSVETRSIVITKL